MSDQAPGNPINPGGARQTPYDIGGQPPYGYMQTPGYTALWNPILTPGQGIDPVNEVALYDRMDWNTAVEGYTNPPFIGVGSSNQSVPKFMQGPDGTARILRGYIRRSQVAAWGTLGGLDTSTDAGKADEQTFKDTNARLYFMYNPSQVTRQYVSYQALAGSNPAAQSPESVLSSQSIPATVTMSMELFFDRQEEVARFPNHPGVLVDLAVFDKLIGNKATSYDDILKRDKEALNPTTANATDIIALPSSSVGGSAASLQPDIKLYLTIVMSPSLVFEGKIMEASALFQKFSHRMTPTQMIITISLLINYSGKLQSSGAFSAADAASAAATKASYEEKSKLNPDQYKVASSDEALSLNAEGRSLAVDWANKWTAAAQIKLNGPAAPWGAGQYGVYYDNTSDPMSGRCGNWQNDDVVLTDSQHWPTAFDCSSLIWRAYNVYGWVDRLHLGKVCGASSDGFLTAAQQNDDVWSFAYAGQDPSISASGGAPPSWSSVYTKFNTWNPQNTGAAGPAKGDLLVRTVGTHHIAFILSNDGQGSDPGAWKWTLLESTDFGHPVETVSTTTAQICGTDQHRAYQYILRAHPLHS
jgi:hypothetical protein